MAETAFAVKYDGPAVREGRMDVMDLAPALLALGEIFTEASAMLAPQQPAVALEISATEIGSFDVHLILRTAQSGWDQLVDLFGSDSSTALVNLKEIVIGTGLGVLWLIKSLRGRKIATQQPGTLAPGTVRLNLDDDTSLEVPAATVALYRNVRIRRATRKLVQPLTREGIDLVEIRSDEVVTVSIGTEDVDAFEAPPAVEETVIVDQQLPIAVSIASVAFVENNKWRLSDGDRTFYATIEDKDFLDRVDRGVEVFRKGDILRCVMRIRQVQRDGALHTEYSVLEVTAHIPATVPVQLTFGAEDAAEDVG